MSGSTLSTTVGLLSACFAVFLFGVFALPVKTSKVGDGVVFQWFMCCGILFVGCITWYIQCSIGNNAGISSARNTCPQFEPVSSLGGAVWCVSNLMLVPIVDCIGLGLCMMLWGTVECLTGWASGRFGILISPERISDPTLNSVGVALAFISLSLVVMIQPGSAGGVKIQEVVGMQEGSGAAPLLTQISFPFMAHSVNGASATSAQHSDAERQPLLGGLPLVVGSPPPGKAGEDEAGGEAEYKWTDSLSSLQKRAVGVSFSLVAGVLSGSTFLPPQYVVNQVEAFQSSSNTTTIFDSPYPGASVNLIDHLFSHFVGIWLMSSTIFMAYMFASRSPLLCFRVQFFATEVPAHLSAGVCWGLAMVAWFLANENLSIVISYPIVTVGPGLVSLFIGLIWFREITGLNNILLLIASQVVYIGGSVCMVLSNQ